MPKAPLATTRSAAHLLRYVLDEPELVRAVRQLPSRSLAALVRRIGLHDAGEIVALASSEQLQQIFDDDLWVTEAPGDDEQFDADRFGLWLEVMLEAGPEATARRLAELPEDFLAMSVLQHALVVDLDALAEQLSGWNEEDEALLEKALDSHLHLELDAYRVISRGTRVWDALVETLLALDRDHHSLLCRILERCCAATASLAEDHEGLYEVLSSADMLSNDVAAERADRRSAAGFVAPSDARAFLELTRQSSVPRLRDDREEDPVTRAYFRELDSEPVGAPPLSQSDTGQAATRLQALIAADGETSPTTPSVRQLGGREPSEQRLAAAMRALEQLQPAEHDRAMQELAYLANILLSGERDTERPLRPADAARLAAGFCARGLSQQAEGPPAQPDAQKDARIIERWGLVRLFRLAYRDDNIRTSLLSAEVCSRGP